MALSVDFRLCTRGWHHPSTLPPSALTAGITEMS